MKTLLCSILLSLLCFPLWAKEPLVKYFDPSEFMMDQTTLPDIHVWAGEPFKIDLKEIPRREVPYGITWWFKEVEWLPDSWTPLGKSGKLDVTEDCQYTDYPDMHISGCGANLLSFSEAHLHSHMGRFLGRYISAQSHLYFYVTVFVHQPQTVVVPVWYGTHHVPRWQDVEYDQILRFQCHSLGGHAGLPTYSEVKNYNQKEVRGWGSNRTSLLGSGKAHVKWGLDAGEADKFDVRCCVKGEGVKLLNKCGAWVHVELRANIHAPRRRWCPKFTGQYTLTKDTRTSTDVSVESKCRHPVAKLHGAMKNRVCEGQTVTYFPHYTAEGWMRQSLASPRLDNMLPFAGDSGSSVGPHNLTIYQMSHRYAGWYLYNTSKVAAREILADFSMEPKLRVFVQLQRLEHKVITIKCVTNIDHDRHANLRVWWDISSSVHAIKKLDARTLQIEFACFNKRLLLNYLWHIRCQASTSLQTGSSDWFSGNGWQSFWEPTDTGPDNWQRYVFGV